MSKYKIAVLPGDGIGKEVMTAAKYVLEKINLDAEYIEGNIGMASFLTEGTTLPEKTIALLKATDCALLGAVSSLGYDENGKIFNILNYGVKEVKVSNYISPVLKIRQEFNLHTNMRVCKTYPGNPNNYREDINIVIFRENTEDVYAGVEFNSLPNELFEVMRKYSSQMEKFKHIPAEDVKISCRIFTRQKCEKIARNAFEYAVRNKRTKITAVEKPMVVRATGNLFLEECRKVASFYKSIEYGECNIDAAFTHLIRTPEKFDIIVTSNLFGDILSSLCAELTGGIGIAPSANIGDEYAFFEPIHGSAPDIAGLWKANPIGMILSVKLMLEYLGEMEKATLLENAVSSVIQEGKVRTFDLGGNSSTLEVGRSIALKYEELENAI